MKRFAILPYCFLTLCILRTSEVDYFALKIVMKLQIWTLIHLIIIRLQLDLFEGVALNQLLIELLC